MFSEIEEAYALRLAAYEKRKGEVAHQRAQLTAYYAAVDAKKAGSSENPPTRIPGRIDFILAGIKAEMTIDGVADAFPAMDEDATLEFLEYVLELKRRGEKLLFPDLRARGDKTPLGNLFDKHWVKILDQALPDARAQRKTLHSMRTNSNTAILNAREPDAIRKQLLGHKQQGVNEEHYLDVIEYQAKLAALMALPIVTKHLEH